MNLDVSYYYDIKVKASGYTEIHTVIAPTAIIAWLKCLEQGYEPMSITLKSHD